MNRNWLSLLAGGFLAIVLLAGCAEFKEAWKEAMDPEAEVTNDPNSEDYKPKYVVHINAIVKYPRAGQLEKEIQTFDNKTVWINTNQSFSSKNIKDARAVARPGSPDIYDLQFQLDRFGKLQWQILSGNHSDDAVALVVDGVYFGRFFPEAPNDENADWVTLRVGINPTTAKGIAKAAAKNYTHLNPDSKNWW